LTADTLLTVYGKELEGFEEKMVDTKNRLDMQKVQELGGHTHSS
jgi:hypothetical protein